MYAVIEQGSKQYKVSQGDVINVDLMEKPGEAKTVELDKVLFVSDGTDVKVGSPYLEGAKVTAQIGDEGDDGVVKGPKLYPTHFRKRKNSRCRTGHRQKYLQLVIESINA